MSVSRREALLKGAILLPASGLALGTAKAQPGITGSSGNGPPATGRPDVERVPVQPPASERPAATAASPPAAQATVGNPGDLAALGDDPLLAACLLVDGRKQIANSRYAAERATNDDVKAFARAEVAEHENIAAKLARLGYEYPNTPAAEALRPVPGTGAGTARTGDPLPARVSDPRPAVSDPPLADTPRPVAVGRILLPPGASTMVRTSDEVADRCIANFAAVMDRKRDQQGGLKFDKAYIGQQLHEHYGLLDKAQVFGRKATAQMKPVVAEGQRIIEQHIATLEQLMAKLDGVTTTELRPNG